MLLPLGEWRRTVLMISQHWFRYWLGAIRHQAITWTNFDEGQWRHMTSSGHNELRPDYIYLLLPSINVSVHYGIISTNKLLLNSLRLSDAYMHQWPNHHQFRWLAPSHYLNQHWNIVNLTHRNKLKWNVYQNSYIFIEDDTFENVACEMLSISSQLQCVKYQYLQVFGCNFYCNSIVQSIICGILLELRSCSLIAYKSSQWSRQQKGWRKVKVGLSSKTWIEANWSLSPTSNFKVLGIRAS